MTSFWSVPEASQHVIAFCFFFALARSLLDKLVFRGLATWLMSKGAASERTNEDRRKRIAKCSESMRKLIYYVTAEAYILQIAYCEPWFRDTKEYFRGWPYQELKVSLKLYYMYQCGFYIYSIAALLTWETRRKDFFVMMGHHIVTVILIGYSYFLRFFRIGSIILALHDASDAFLEAAKLFHYVGNEFGAIVFFLLFAISWLIFRLTFFPFRVIKSSCYDVQEFIDLSQPYNILLYYVFNSMLLTLLVFHIYWWGLICLMIKKQMRNRERIVEDIRSDSEDDD